MNTNSSIQPRPISRPAGFHLQTAKTICIALAAITALFNARPATAANIVWISDANDPATGFFPTDPGFTDSRFVTLLQNAGHNVIRYNQPNAQATLLTQAEIDALNTNDLLIIGRCVNSGAFQTGQGNQWNTAITKPIIDQSAFHARLSRLGWFTANEGPDNTPTILSAEPTGNPATDAAVDYLFGGVPMNGTNTAFPYDVTADRNSSQIVGAPVAGGIVYAKATYVTEGNTAVPPAAPTTAVGNVIVGFPAGTPVRAGVDVLAGYRMFFASGSRESAAYPAGIPIYAGRENLTLTGEEIFLRAVQLAINNGAAPATDPSAPPSVVNQPASVTVNRGGSVTLSITVAGAAPRTVQWQRDIGDGITFTNIPDAVSPFLNSRLALPVVGTEDDNAKFRAEVSNANGTLSSETVTLTVTPDNAPPVPLSAATIDGTSIVVCFDELLNDAPDNNPATDPFSYILTDTGGVGVNAVKLSQDGRSVTLGLDGVASPNYTLSITAVDDRFGNAIPEPGVVLSGAHFGFTAIDVGTPAPTGTNYSCGGDSFVVGGGATTGGGSTLANDIQPTAEHFRFVHKTVSGDFDARVRVLSLLGTPDHLETIAKAMLSARATADANAPSVNAFVTPSYPADNTYGATARTSAGALTSSNFVTTAYVPNALPVAYPNAWLRMTRAGDLFTTFRSDNGTDWFSLGSITVPMGPTALVGTGATSHRNGRLAFATFSNFSISQTPPSPTLTGLTYAAGSFTASFQTQNGVTYTVQYKDNLNAASWSTLTTVSGDGTVKSFTDPGPAGPQRFYQVIVP